MNKEYEGIIEAYTKTFEDLVDNQKNFNEKERCFLEYHFVMLRKVTT